MSSSTICEILQELSAARASIDWSATVIKDMSFFATFALSAQEPARPASVLPPRFSRSIATTSYHTTGSGRDLHQVHHTKFGAMPRTGVLEGYTEHGRYVAPRRYQAPLVSRTGPLVHANSWTPNGSGRDTFVDCRLPYVPASQAGVLRNAPASLQKGLGPSNINFVHKRAGTAHALSAGALARAQRRQRRSANRLSTPCGLSQRAFASLSASRLPHLPTEGEAATAGGEEFALVTQHFTRRSFKPASKR